MKHESADRLADLDADGAIGVRDGAIEFGKGSMPAQSETAANRLPRHAAASPEQGIRHYFTSSTGTDTS
jgi:hypothetical protein